MDKINKRKREIGYVFLSLFDNRIDDTYKNSILYAYTKKNMWIAMNLLECLNYITSSDVCCFGAPSDGCHADIAAAVTIKSTFSVF